TRVAVEIELDLVADRLASRSGRRVGTRGHHRLIGPRREIVAVDRDLGAVRAHLAPDPHRRVRRWRRNRLTGIRHAGARSGVGAAFDGAFGRRAILTLGTTIVREAALDVVVRGRRDGLAGVRVARGRLDHDAALGGALVGGAILALRAAVVGNAADQVGFHRRWLAPPGGPPARRGRRGRG